MEVAVAFEILKIAGSKLFSLLASEFAFITGMQKDLLELQDIHGQTAFFLTTLRDLTYKNDPRYHWVIKLQDIAYEIDDLLFELHLEAEKHKTNNGSGKHAITDCFCTKPLSFLYRYKVARKIKSIQMKLAAIARQRSHMNAIGHSITLGQPILNENKENTELSLLTNVEESQIPTRDLEKVGIINKLLESNEYKHYWIVSIVGLGGTGKTTLAKHICHDNKIKEQFKDKIYWVYVSQEFNLKNLIGKVFEAITMQKLDFHAPQHMLKEISKKLTCEKYLLVLDDAWHHDKEDWNKFLVHLKGHATGSKLLLTTRDQKVAEAIKSDHIFNLAYLSHVESWTLFLKNSGWKEEDLSLEFKQYGKKIVDKCGGVPLAIKTLGSILSEKWEISTWRAISQSDLWIEENIEGRVFTSLKLSYINLKDDLKECFVFCSIFPKGYMINKNYLIEQWIANGFINGRMDEQPEIIGNSYFELLVKVGFLDETRASWYNNEVAYKMHDLIHDLIQYILHSEVVNPPQTNITKGCKQKCRYLSLTSCGEKVQTVSFRNVRALCAPDAYPSLDKIVKKNPYICSVVLNCVFGSPFPLFVLNLDYLGYLEIYGVFCTKLPEGISGLWNLQSLHLIYCNGFVALPTSIGKLKKLRNLELTGTDIERLPQSIGECRQLQSLKIHRCNEFRVIPNTIGENENLRVLEIVNCLKLQLLPPEVTLISRLECLSLEDCSTLVQLPRGIGNFINLEFLNLRGCNSLNCMPSGIEQLTRLKRLDLYVVGQGGDDARMSDLENLNMISGEMIIKNLPHFMDSSDAEKVCLKKKKNICNLSLVWSESVMEEELDLNFSALDALEPPSQINMLQIDGYRGTHLPCWMSTQSKSSHLESATTIQAGFLCLSELRLFKMPNLKHMRGILVFPLLKTLELVDMPNLEELYTTTGLGGKVGERHCFPLLSHLKINRCPKLIVMPNFPPSLEYMYVESCKSELLSRGRASIPLPDVDGPSICSDAFLVAPHLNRLILGQMVMSVSDWGFLQYLVRLEYLVLYDFDEGFTELPESMWGLTSLKMLDIYKCFLALPDWLGNLHSLQRITIYNCPMMDNLPQSIEYLTFLQELVLVSCEVLTKLPEGIGKLFALHRLDIKQCPALRSLPTSIQCLTSLEVLLINGCPELARRYKKEVGEDWHLISHIPCVLID